MNDHAVQAGRSAHALSRHQAWWRTLGSEVRSVSFWIVTGFVLAALSLSGCYAPLTSHGISASSLPDEYRMPFRTQQPKLNLASLGGSSTSEHRLVPGDVMQVTIPGLYRDSESRPLRAAVLGEGVISLPQIGEVEVGGLTLFQAQRRIATRFEQEQILTRATAAVELLQVGTFDIVVLGKVTTPGTYPLANHQNNLAHALAAAGELSEEAGDWVEIHRAPQYTMPCASAPNLERSDNRVFNNVRPVSYEWSHDIGMGPPSQLRTTNPGARSPLNQFDTTAQPSAPATIAPSNYPDTMLPPVTTAPNESDCCPPFNGCDSAETHISPIACEFSPIVRIPLAGMETCLMRPEDMSLYPGDVVVVPQRTDQVFYVVGLLSQRQAVRFTVSNKDREIGTGFVLPKNREIDVVTAVAMAGYIDPIDSPTTVTLHRILPNGRPLLVIVDLLRARRDPRETMLVQANDIIYVNPDSWWWFRRTFDRVIDNIIIAPFDQAIFRR